MTNPTKHDPTKDEIDTEIQHILGHCMCMSNPDCWFRNNSDEHPTILEELQRNALTDLIDKRVREAEIKLRHDIASQAPECEHGLQDDKEHKEYCGFINNIWVNWAVKNKASLNELKGE